MKYEPRKTADRIKAVIRRAGETPWLVGYDINGIQDLITASSRPITMHGASETLRMFDAAQANQPLSIFAGGGRGYELAASKDEAQKRVATFQGELSKATVSGVVAAATVQFNASDVRMSLALLRRKLDNAKDAAPRPGGEIPADKNQQCQDCHALVKIHPSHDGPDARQICVRCGKFIDCVRGGDISESLKHYANDRRLAAVSADGNNMGDFFGKLRTLEELATASEAIADIFKTAHHRAKGNKKILAPVTGGDDIRAFMAPELVLEYVEELTNEVHEGVRRAGDLNGVLSKESSAPFSRIGIGIGAVVAGDHYPAAQLLGHATILEKQAKEICRGKSGARSAFDFAILTSETTAGARNNKQQLSMESSDWNAALDNARALRIVPATQRTILVDRFSADSPEEFYNRFRYQVARSKKWQKWLEDCRVKWQDPAELQKHVEKTRIDLIDLLPKGEYA